MYGSVECSTMAWRALCPSAITANRMRAGKVTHRCRSRHCAYRQSPEKTDVLGATKRPFPSFLPSRSISIPGAVADRFVIHLSPWRNTYNHFMHLVVARLDVPRSAVAPGPPDLRPPAQQPNVADTCYVAAVRRLVQTRHSVLVVGEQPRAAVASTIARRGVQ